MAGHNGWCACAGKKVRAQRIGISAAPNMTGQARGEGGKGWPAALSKRDRLICSGWSAAAPATRQQNICRSGSRLGEFEETSERLTPTNVAAALNGLGGHSHVRDIVQGRW